LPRAADALHAEVPIIVGGFADGYAAFRADPPIQVFYRQLISTDQTEIHGAALHFAVHMVAKLPHGMLDVRALRAPFRRVGEKQCRLLVERGVTGAALQCCWAKPGPVVPGLFQRA